MGLPNDNLNKKYSSDPEKQGAFEQIRAGYELQKGGWIFDLVYDKVFKSYGDTLPLLLWRPWMDILQSFLQDQKAFKYQIEEFGRDFAEKGYSELLKKEEESYSRACAYWSESNSHQTKKELLEAFGFSTDKKPNTQEYFNDFEAYYESVQRKDIVHADLCLKFRLELKKRLFSANSTHTSNLIDAPGKVQYKQNAPNQGRKKDPEIQNRNARIYAEFIRYTLAENKKESDAYNRLAKTYRDTFKGDIKRQIRRIVGSFKTDTNGQE